MLTLGSQLIHTPVLSLQTGTQLAVTSRALIDPAKFAVAAYEVTGPLVTEVPTFLRVNEVRELGRLGMIIDSADEFIGLEDVIKIKEINELEFQLTDLNVVDETNRKLGKVSDYTVDTESFYVQQIHVQGGMLKRLLETDKTIHRSQIVEINNTSIIVRTTAKKLEPVRSLTQPYTNPFRTQGNRPQANNTDTR